MKIETKYDVGQEVWFMWSNRPIKRKIAIINIWKDAKVQGNTYHLQGEDDEGNPFYTYFDEIELFPTKEELLKSL